MNSNWQTIKRIFQAALELSGQQREDFLHKECKDNPQILRTVLSMLQALESHPDFLDTQSDQFARILTETVQEKTLIGQIVGKYRLIEKIGEGGMGVVYRAERADQAYRVAVAIKIITFSLNRQELARRFLLERQTLANLNHPYIARLLDGGTTPEGFPYLVMEYVDGVPIDEYCQTHNLNPVQRIDLFLKVCEAVKYAHQNLVIHRDLKPDNVLVDKEGRPRLLDFGIAKILDPDASVSNRTRTLNTSRFLTPHYASPEQVTGKPTSTLTDVYSLGILLFKLLTGTLPFDFSGKSISEIEQLICYQEPPRPSETITIHPSKKTTGETLPDRARVEDTRRLRNFLKGDLDVIILKALQKEPGDRYLSVEQLMEDLQRFLNGYPIMARPASFRNRMGKFLRRHKIGVLFTAGFFFLMMVGIVGILWQASVAKKQRDQALKESQKSEKVIEFLQSMLAAPDPYESGKDITVLELLDRTSSQIKQKFANQPDVEIVIRRTLGSTYQELGKYKKALLHFERELELCKNLYGVKNPETARAFIHVALNNHYLGNLRVAKPQYQEALDILRGLSQVDAELMGEALNDYATLLTDEANYAEAEKLFRESLELIIQQQGEANQEAFAAINNIAIVLRRQGKLAEAMRYYKRAMIILTKISDKLTPAKAIILGNIGKIYLEKGNYTDAQNYYLQSLKGLETLLGKDNPMLFSALLNLGITQYHLKNYHQSKTYLNRAIRVLQTQNSRSDPQLAMAYIALAKTASRLEQYREANKLFSKAIDIRRKVFGAAHKLTARAEKDYGEFLIERHNYNRAKAYLLSAFQVFSHDSTATADMIECGQALINVYQKLKDLEAADKLSILIQTHSKF